MPNIASILKSEISRVARKEVRAEILTLKKSASAHRKEIAALKQRAQALEQALRRLGRSQRAAAEPASADDAASGLRRFSAKGLLSLRNRLGLSAAECGALVGASSQSIYNWEQGKARPSAKHLPAISALRAMGKREATARLAALAEAA
jgi:DNA-binding transcriptional regulator YiaG